MSTTLSVFPVKSGSITLHRFAGHDYFGKAVPCLSLIVNNPDCLSPIFGSVSASLTPAQAEYLIAELQRYLDTQGQTMYDYECKTLAKPVDANVPVEDSPQRYYRPTILDLN